MDARQLEYFLAIVDHDGFGRAAQHLHLAQPSLSQSIANLERELGIQLFHRIGRAVVLSTAGSELVEPARQVLRDLRTARASVDSVKGLQRGTLELVTMPSPGIEPLGALTRRFTRRHPGVTLGAAAAFTPAEVVDKVRQGSCELGLVGAPGPLTAPGIDVLALEQQPFVLVGGTDGAFPDEDPVPHAALTGALRMADRTELDWVVVRENSEGEYAGFGGRNLAGRGPGNEVALQTALFTEKGCERIIRFAFDLARTRTRKKVSSVTKSNAQQYGMVLWDEVFARVSQDYPDAETESVLVDAMSAKFVLKPEDLSVVVASNLNADILSDLGSALAGSLGLAASANYNPERRFPSMFEPVHGSAPDIAGQGRANPIGAILSGALMLDQFGLDEQAARLRKAVDTATGAGVLTRDIGGTATTDQVVTTVIESLTP